MSAPIVCDAPTPPQHAIGAACGRLIVRAPWSISFYDSSRGAGEADDRPDDRGSPSLTKAAARRNSHFDEDYYRRYYQVPETAVVTPEMQRNEVALVIAFCRYIELDIKRFSDVGAGTGWWAKEFAKRYPACFHVETFDASEDACRLFGHRHREVQKLRGPQSDLIVCRDVLRYLDDDDAEEAIRRLARKCRGVLYVHVITSDDDIDEDASDMSGFFRSKAWYRRRFRKAGFRDCGMGLYVSKKFEDFVPFAIESR